MSSSSVLEAFAVRSPLIMVPARFSGGLPAATAFTPADLPGGALLAALLAALCVAALLAALLGGAFAEAALPGGALFAALLLALLFVAEVPSVLTEERVDPRQNNYGEGAVASLASPPAPDAPPRRRRPSRAASRRPPKRWRAL